MVGLLELYSRDRAIVGDDAQRECPARSPDSRAGGDCLRGRAGTCGNGYWGWNIRRGAGSAAGDAAKCEQASE